MAKSVLQVHIKIGEGAKSVTVIEEYHDWFDFADYVKQQTLKRECVTIVEWNYVQRSNRGQR